MKKLLLIYLIIIHSLSTALPNLLHLSRELDHTAFFREVVFFTTKMLRLRKFSRKKEESIRRDHYQMARS